MSEPLAGRIARQTRRDERGCILWTGALTAGGYGQIQVGGRPRRVHRVAYEIHFGEVPPGKMVCHRCDVPLCVNPEHLFAGSATDNARDRDAKGRAADQRGERGPSAVLSPAEVLEMRSVRESTGASYRDLGRMFGVSATAAWRAARGDSFQNLERDARAHAGDEP